VISVSFTSSSSDIWDGGVNEWKDGRGETRVLSPHSLRCSLFYLFVLFLLCFVIRIKACWEWFGLLVALLCLVIDPLLGRAAMLFGGRFGRDEQWVRSQFDYFHIPQFSHFQPISGLLLHCQGKSKHISKQPCRSLNLLAVTTVMNDPRQYVRYIP